MSYQDWGYPEIIDWEDNRYETTALRPCFPYGCTPRIGCSPRFACFPYQDCAPRVGCSPYVW